MTQSFPTRRSSDLRQDGRNCLDLLPGVGTAIRLQHPRSLRVGNGRRVQIQLMRRKPRREKTMRKMSLTVSILGAFLTAALLPLAGRAGTYDLTIAKTAANGSGKPENAMTVNGQ